MKQLLISMLSGNLPVKQARCFVRARGVPREQDCYKLYAAVNAVLYEAEVSSGIAVTRNGKDHFLGIRVLKAAGRRVIARSASMVRRKTSSLNSFKMSPKSLTLMQSYAIV